MADFTTKVLSGLLGGYHIMMIGLHTITTDGHILSVDTGLNRIIGAWTQVISDAPTTSTEAAYCTIDHGADGLLDIYAWQDDIATEAATETTCYVLVIGY